MRSHLTRRVALSVCAAFAMSACVSVPGTPTELHTAPAAHTVQLTADTTDPVLWEALIRDGYRGMPGDGCECLYVPAWTVLDVPGGTWTVTPDTGPRRCEDGTTGECTGREFLPAVHPA